MMLIVVNNFQKYICRGKTYTCKYMYKKLFVRKNFISKC